MLADMMRFGTEAAQKGLDDSYFRYHPMMWWGTGNNSTFWLFWILWLVTWVLVIIALVALIRWLWKKGDKK